MSDFKKLKRAKKLIAENKNDEAIKILWELYACQNQKIKFQAILYLIYTLDHFTENKRLLEIVEEGIKMAPKLGENDIEVNLLVEKCNFLNTKLGLMTYRQKNLKMSENVFKWINFSTEREKREFEFLTQNRVKIEEEIQSLESKISKYTEDSNSHYFKGNVFLRLGEFYGTKFFNDQLDSMIGGKTRSKFANMYFVKRWNLGKWFLYKKVGRKKIQEDWSKCLDYLELAISEFEAGSHGGEMAHSYYNLATKYGLTFRFKKTKTLLDHAEKLANTNNEKLLLSKIELYRKELANKNKNIRDTVGEYGLDLPNNLK
ncbi:hypothetical protein BK004_03675 [bacterium CG10_46_32]|nr:MAG: hypothetical protein BK004_03675 [bacterium CG10_46_32]PIR55898.1 MAG: hypothetical protein COU73_03705 [Parcubacteria group bacterium CG10_big_fil_rev_8_21_14_0_10_46_32]